MIRGITKNIPIARVGRLCQLSLVTRNCWNLLQNTEGHGHCTAWRRGYRSNGRMRCGSLDWLVKPPRWRRDGRRLDGRLRGVLSRLDVDCLGRMWKGDHWLWGRSILVLMNPLLGVELAARCLWSTWMGRIWVSAHELLDW